MAAPSASFLCATHPNDCHCHRTKLTHRHLSASCSVAFSALFEVAPFVLEMRQRANLTTIDSAMIAVDAVGPRLNVSSWNDSERQLYQVSSCRLTMWTPGPFEGWGLAGWRTYKYGCPTSECKKNNIPREPWRSTLEDAVLSGLQAAAVLRQRIEAVQARLRLPSAPSDVTTGYGCLHARIERDMKISWAQNRAGRPPSLNEYLAGVAALPELRRTPCIFVAVGLAISNDDAAVLDRNQTGWGARLTRTINRKAWHRGTRNATAPSYTEAAIVDFMVCRGADWLVGWPGSTFARALAALQRVDHQRGWYRACPFPGSVEYIEGLLLDHAGCVANGRTGTRWNKSVAVQ